MAKASIHVEDQGEGLFAVTVTEAATSTTHEVTLADADYLRFRRDPDSREALVQRCFEFLLEREPKESILGRFDISVISRYFPEFDQVIQGGR